VINPHVAGEMRVKWTPGRASDKHPHVVAGETEGQWHAADGYAWAANPPVQGDMRVNWTPGRPSERDPHVVAASLEGEWRPADGYTWVINPHVAGEMRVKWTPGRASDESPNVIAGEIEGNWSPASGYTWLDPSAPKDFRVKRVETAIPVPSPMPEFQKPEISTAFQDGLTDRRAWEQWFASLTDDKREGAYYWSGQRSLPKPGSCYGQGHKPEFIGGCNEAKQRLTPTDIRRKFEPDYRQGWNSYYEPPAGPSTGPGTLSPPFSAPSLMAAEVRWYPDMDAPGNDLGGRDGWVRAVNADDCGRKCLADRNCVGFTYNITRSVCIPKSRMASLIHAEDAATTGVIIGRTELPTFSNSTAHVQQYPGMDAPGNDRGSWISGVSGRDCESICVADTGCAGYTYTRQKLTCIPKSFIGALAPYEGALTGVVEGRNVSGH
jgi:hypothetical protein